MSLEWNKLRQFDGSVNNAFEELCAQVARLESAQLGHRFVRNGKPDGGLECFSERPDGTLKGWQAKFFERPPTPQQWADLAASFKRAVKAYPTLQEFVVCLPLDRGTKGGDRQLAMERWEHCVRQWTTWAAKLGRTIRFDYWGTSELFASLSKREELGRLKFWFEGEFLDEAWFRRQFEIAADNNRRRYRPEIHVDVPSANWFPALLQTQEFIQSLRRSLRAVIDKGAVYLRWKNLPAATGSIGTLIGQLGRLQALVDRLPRGAEARLPLDEVRTEIRAIMTTLRHELEATPNSLPEKEHDDWYRAFRGLYAEIDEAAEYSEGEFRCINQARALLVYGRAGHGKTHTLFRLADERTAAKLPVVTLTGVQFSQGDPWSQLIDSLGLSCTRDEFLGALNAAGEARQVRSLLAIDALNETDNPGLWKHSLGGMLKAIEPYRFVALALSLRGEFAQTIVPDGLAAESLPSVVQQGFAGMEAAATARIFEYYKLETPQIPLLDPEFSDPLFVITLAETLSRSGMRRLEAGRHSLGWMFDAWIDAIDQRLSQPDKVNYDMTERWVSSACQAMARKMSEQGSRLLPIEDARAIVAAIQPSAPWSRSLLRHMVSEDVIQRLQLYNHRTKVVHDYVRFTFDRFADQHIARSLLAGHKDLAALRAAFAPGGTHYPRLCRVRNGHEAADPGLLEAMAIEVAGADRFGCELHDVLADPPTLRSQAERAVIDSLPLRVGTSVHASAVALFRDEFRSIRTAAFDTQCEIIERALLLSTRPGHPLNADFLDAELREEPMPKRDFWWSRPLTALRADESVTMRLVNWMLGTAARAADEDTARLAMTAAAWLFSTSERFIRDRATKAMVSMLMHRPALAARLITRFLEVDDPYVSERVLAVGYGVALRTHDNAGLKTLADIVWRLCFLEAKLPVHLLSRDYARGIVDAAVRRKALEPVDEALLNPPYTSDWPQRISVVGDWKYLREGDAWKTDRGLSSIHSSVFHDDFGIYVIDAKGWLRTRLVDPSVNPPKRDARQLVKDVAEAHSQPEPGESYADPDRPASAAAIRRPTSFPRLQISHMIMDEVVRLGYTSALDEDVRTVGRSFEYVGRMGPKSERLGKKYQWIAYYRTLARIADRFRFGGEKEPTPYRGPWQISNGRDIDPSCLLRSTKGGSQGDTTACWWAPFIARAGIDAGRPHAEWLMQLDRIPTIANLTEVVEPSSGNPWIVGYSFTSLYSPPQWGTSEADKRRRHMWYKTGAILVRKGHAAQIVDWLNAERRLPGTNGHGLLAEPPHLWKCFLGEFPDSEAWSFENTPYFGREPWTDAERSGCPTPYCLLADRYFEDDDLDCGRDAVLDFYLPSSELWSGLRLRHSDRDGCFIGPAGQVLAFDPSIRQLGPSTLLIDKAALLKWTHDNGMELACFVYGEQMVHSDSMSDREYLGRMLFSGAFRHDGSSWVGLMDSRFESSDGERIEQPKAQSTAAKSRSPKPKPTTDRSVLPKRKKPRRK